jgi:hypothetical protein
MVPRMTIDFPEMFDIPVLWNLQEWSDHKIPRGFFGTHLAPLRPSSPVLRSAKTSLLDPRIHLSLPPHVSSFHGELPMEMAVKIASHITMDAADPMEDLGSLWATCS